MAPQRALIVDADWKMRKLVRTNLEAQGFAVAEAVNGRECGEALARERCDLLLLNVDQPDGNGWNLVAALRRTPAAADLRIVVIVAEPARGRLLQRFTGVRTLLAPFSAAELLACVACVLRTGQ